MSTILSALTALDLAPGGRVLDAGCGSGPHLGHFARAVGPGGLVVGLDRDVAALRRASAARKELQRQGTVVLCAGDHDAPPFADATFDLVWLSATLHHAPDPATTLFALRRLVRPSGQIAVLDADEAGSFPFLPWPPDFEARLRAASAAAALAGYDGALPYRYHPYLGRALPALFRTAGLQGVRPLPLAEITRAPLGPDRAAAIHGWFTGPFLGRVGPFLAPRDRDHLLRLVAPTGADSLLSSPDFFLARTWFLGIGHVP